MTTIAELRDLLASATPGPWDTWTNGFDSGIVSDSQEPFRDGDRQLIFGGEPHEGYIDPNDDNALLVVAAVNALPALLQAAEALEALTEAHHCYHRVGVEARAALEKLR